ncbi:MAG: pentapeptide repeat-containing protein, partial [Bacteroidota bacterium]
AFSHSQLQLCTFTGMKLNSTLFQSCQLHEVDFSEANLSEARFDACDLQGATFERTILHRADFRTARNFTIHPERNALKKARFSSRHLAGLLQHHDLDIETLDHA